MKINISSSNQDRRSLPALLAAQTQVVFTDNAAKLALIGLIQFPGIVSENQSLQLISIIAGLLVLPFVLLAPMAGWVSDRFPKRSLLNSLLIAQLVAVAFILFGLFNRSLTVAITGFALLAIQSCFFSPAKQAILKEIVGEKRLGVAVGWMEMLGTAAILCGSLCGAWLFDRFTPFLQNNPWQAALAVTAILGSGAIFSLLIFQNVRKTSSQSTEPFNANLLWKHFDQLRHLWKKRPLRLAALGNAYIYALGGLLYLTLIQIGRESHGGGTGSVSETGILFALLGIGVAAGSLFAAHSCRRQIRTGLISFGAIGLALSLFGLAFTVSTATQATFLFTLGIAGGFVIVPANAFLQAKAADSERGRIIASSNLLTNLAGVGAVFLHYLLAQILGLSTKTQFLLMAVPATFTAAWILRLLASDTISLSIQTIARILYRPRTTCIENIPQTGGALLVGNHISYLDAILIQTITPRPVRFVAWSGLQKVWWLRLFFKVFRIIPIDPARARDGIRDAAEFLKNGEIVCIFPEGAISRTGSLQAIRKGFSLIARRSGAPVIPFHIDGLWGSGFTFSGNRFFKKLPFQHNRQINIRIGNPVPPETADSPAILENLLLLGNENLSARPQLNRHLGRELLSSLSKKPWKTALIDTFPGRRSLSRAKLLGLSLLLARKWKKEFPENRIGIALPPGIGGAVANLAAILADKIPVNLNFTAGPAAIESALQQAGINTLITADTILNRTKNIPWPADCRDIRNEIAQFGKLQLLSGIAAAFILPASFLNLLLRLPKTGGDRECALLFTSGSSGTPKGVPLSHRNLLGNLLQISETNFLQPNDRLLGSLPLFHSFGFTVTLWAPLLRGITLITSPSPLDPRKISQTIENEAATILAGTATFLRPYPRIARPEQLRSLRMVVAGAEKLPASLSDSFLEKFNLPILEGYGLTETSPCLSVNMPKAPGPESKSDQLASQTGSVGRLLPGIAARIIDPETGEKLPLNCSGLLQVRGPNIFTGYLNDPGLSTKVLAKNWFNTGDICRFDDDGFLLIEGRLSRFSKIAGEMVPHELLEEKIRETIGITAESDPSILIVGIPDSERGEKIVLLTTSPIDPINLRQNLTARGIPNLWLPRSILPVHKIPLLPTGKTDLLSARLLAQEIQQQPLLC